MSWLRENAESIEAVGTAVSAVATVAAIFAIGYQLNRNDDAQSLQAARAAYENHLNQSLTYPHLAAPKDGCALIKPTLDPSYGTFMEQLTYTAEQMLGAQTGWESTFNARFEPHIPYVCEFSGQISVAEDARQLLQAFVDTHCPETPACE